MKKYKNIIFLLVFLIFSLGIICLNKIVDPYNLNQKYLKKNNSVNDVERSFLYTFLNLTKNFKYDTVLLTGSSGNESLQLEGVENVALLNPSGVSPLEHYDLLKYYLKLHPETKNIIISFEYNAYLDCFNDYSIPRTPSSPFEDFITLYFSLDATKNSFNKLLLTKKKYFENNCEGTCFPFNKFIKHKFEKTCEYDNIEHFKNIQELIKEHNLKAVYFIPPNHALYLSYMLKQGLYENTLKLKRQLAENVSFYDFSFVNKYTSMPLDHLFIDPYHINGHMVSKKVFNIINGREKDDDFAVYITKDNVDEVLNKQKILLQNYVKNNKTVVDEYVNNNENPLSIEEQDVYINLKDLPKEIQDMFHKNNES